MTVWHRVHPGWLTWITLAGALSLMSGAAHILYGIALMNYHGWYLYTGSTLYLLDPKMWGWMLVLGGGLLIFSSVLVLRGSMLGSITGSILALLSIVANIALLNVAPFWSAFAINIDLLILYAILIHGTDIQKTHL